MSAKTTMMEWDSNPCQHQSQKYSGIKSQQSLNIGWLMVIQIIGSAWTLSNYYVIV